MTHFELRLIVGAWLILGVVCGLLFAAFWSI